jgi:hypothetical protein
VKKKVPNWSAVINFNIAIEFQYGRYAALETAYVTRTRVPINPLNAELNPIRHLLALAGAHHFVHVSRIRVNGEAVTELE